MFGESWYTVVLTGCGLAVVAGWRRQRSEQRVVVVGGLRDWLDHVPVLGDPSAGHEIEVHDGTASLVTAVAVQVDEAVVAVRLYSLEIGEEIGVGEHRGERRDRGVPAVGNS